MFPVFPPGFLNGALLNTVRIMFLVGFGLYLIFAFIATRQVSVMRRTLETPLSPIIRLLGYAHFVVAFLALWFAFITLQ